MKSREPSSRDEDAAPEHHRCVLCDSEHHYLFHEDDWRIYLRCAICHLVFVPERFHLSPLAEKAEYDLHQNSPFDARYRKFLHRLYEPVVQRIAANSCGLDFGSGPGPTLSVMLEAAGHSMALVDLYYAPNPDAFDQQYDFVTASEVVEHLRSPKYELERLWSCINPGGLLGIMTKLALDRQAFARWHYKADRTHICFFSKETFAWLARQWNAKLTFAGADVILLEKRLSSD